MTKRLLLEGAINVPSRTTDLSTALVAVVGHSEDVSVRRLRMLEERGLDVAEPTGDLQVSLGWKFALILKN